MWLVSDWLSGPIGGKSKLLQEIPYMSKRDHKSHQDEFFANLVNGKYKDRDKNLSYNSQ